MNRPKYDNTGILFFQDDKDAENKPDWKGNITVKGEELELAGWIKPGKRGNFISLKVSEKRRQDVSGSVPATSGSQARTKTPTAQQAKPQRGRDTDMQSHGSQDDSDLPPF